MIYAFNNLIWFSSPLSPSFGCCFSHFLILLFVEFITFWSFQYFWNSSSWIEFTFALTVSQTIVGAIFISFCPLCICIYLFPCSVHQWGEPHWHRNVSGSSGLPGWVRWAHRVSCCVGPDKLRKNHYKTDRQTDNIFQTSPKRKKTKQKKPRDLGNHEKNNGSSVLLVQLIGYSVYSLERK